MILTASDFMSVGYGRIEEPLNLKSAGQAWLWTILKHYRPHLTGGRALILGAIPWLADKLSRSWEVVFVVDRSEAMLDMLRSPQFSRRKVELIQCDWSHLPCQCSSLDLVIGDNSFSFLPYPAGWESLCANLSSRMSPGAVMLNRICSAPARHCIGASATHLTKWFIQNESVSCTALRAAILFACLDRSSSRIDTEAALEMFERDRATFERALSERGVGEVNDLVTMNKYRGTGASYYAPALGDALDLIARHFDVPGVHFGPYAMSEYFPLIVAECRHPSTRSCEL
jgi:hypothetical protein